MQILIGLLFCTLILGCEGPPSPEFDNQFDYLSPHYAPAAATKLRVTEISETHRRLEWQDNSAKETSFIVDRKEGANGSYQHIASLPQNTSTFDDTITIQTDTTYYYSVYPVSPGGNHAAAESVSFSLKFPVPFNLKFSSLNSSSLQLEWEDSCAFTRYYLVERRVRDGDFAEIARVQAGTKRYVDNQLDPASEYQFRVRGATTVNFSSYSGAVSAEFIPAPSQPQSVKLSSDNNTYSVYATSADGHLAFCGNDTKYMLWDIVNRTLLWQKTGPTIWCGTISRDKTVLACYTEGLIRILDAKTGTELRSIACLSGIGTLRFNPIGTKLVGGDGTMNAQLHCWNVGDGILDWTTEIFAGELYGIDISPDGTMLACRHDASGELRDMNTGSLNYTFPSAMDFGGTMLFSQDSLIYLSDIYKIEVWNFKKRELDHTISGFQSNTGVVSLVSGGSFLIMETVGSVHNSYEFRTWRAPNGTLVQVWNIPSSDISRAFEVVGANLVACLDPYLTLTSWNFNVQWSPISW